MLIQVHRVSSEPKCYLGMIEVPDQIVQDDPDTLLETWWDEFQATEPESDMLFVDFLTLQGSYAEPEGEFRLKRAHEGEWDTFHNNTPHQVYL